MLAANIKEILEKKGRGGWLRVSECAEEYAQEDDSKKTCFYRWRKQVEKGKVSGFQVLKLVGNISFIGLENANPTAIYKAKIDAQYEKRVEAIRNENLSNPIIAYFDLLFFIDTLPSRIKDKLGLELQIATLVIMKANQWRPFEEQAQRQERLKAVMSIVVLSFVNRIPMLLNEEFGTMEEKASFAS
jgi:hypothetical protein